MKNKKLIFGGISLVGFVMALVGMFVPYLSSIAKFGSVQTSHQYELFNADLLNGDGLAWLTISKIAISLHGVCNNQRSGLFVAVTINVLFPRDYISD